MLEHTGYDNRARILLPSSPYAVTRFINATCRGYQCRLVCDGGAFSMVVWWLAIHHRHLLVRSRLDVPILLPARG